MIFAAAKTATPATQRRAVDPRSPADGALGQHREERRRIDDPHDGVHVIWRLDAAARLLRAFVPRGARGFDEHRHEDQQARL